MFHKAPAMYIFDAGKTLDIQVIYKTITICIQFKTIIKCIVFAL